MEPCGDLSGPQTLLGDGGIRAIRPVLRSKALAERFLSGRRSASLLVSLVLSKGLEEDPGKGVYCQAGSKAGWSRPGPQGGGVL